MLIKVEAFYQSYDGRQQIASSVEYYCECQIFGIIPMLAQAEIKGYEGVK